MKKICIILFLVAAINAVNAQTYNGPESIEYDTAGDRYFIANSNNGQILARSNSGTLTVFASGMASGPYGLEIVGSTLYACDGGTIKGFDLSSGSQVANVNLSATFLNGITHVGTDLFITDYSAKKIYRMNTGTNSFNVYVTGLTKSPNGIIYDAGGNRLVFVNWGTNAPIMAVNLSDSTVSTLVTTALGNCDGIAMNCSGQFYVSSWSPNRISRFDNNFVAAPVNMNVTGLSSPADITYNIAEDTLAIPNSGNNTVKFVGYSDCATMSIEKNNSIGFEMYPNPANETINIQSDKIISSVMISDQLGRVIITSHAGVSSTQVNTANLANGIYFISIDNKARKLIIQR